MKPEELGVPAARVRAEGPGGAAGRGGAVQAPGTLAADGLGMPGARGGSGAEGRAGGGRAGRSCVPVRSPSPSLWRESRKAELTVEREEFTALERPLVA